jgi:hypothetical protein
MSMDRSKLPLGEDGKVEVIVTVAPRPDYEGYWSIGHYFRNGPNPAIRVTERELEQLLREPVLVITLASATLSGPVSSGGFGVSDEEQAFIEAWRHARQAGLTPELLSPQDREQLAGLREAMKAMASTTTEAPRRVSPAPEREDRKRGR